MAKENIIKLYKHFSKLAEGNFSESDFDFHLGGEGGRTQIGEMSPARRQLIISDAKRNKEELEKKFPFLTGKEEVKEEKNILDKIAENKKSKKSKK